MPIFVYTAKSQPGKTTRGQIEAESLQAAIHKLIGSGLFPIKVEAEHLESEKPSFIKFTKPSSKDLVFFTNQLSILNESGINLFQSLNILLPQIKNPAFKNILSEVVGKVKDGKSLSESLSVYPKFFSPIYTALVHAGEVGGHIELSLKRLAGFLEKEDEFRSSLRAALVYPSFILGLSIVTIVVLLTFVIPRLSSMFEDMGQMLPLATRILLDISKFFAAYWWMFFLVLALFFIMGHSFLTTPHGRNVFDRFKLKAPVWGQIVLKSEISRFFRTLSLLLSSGIPILSALGVAISVLDNQILKTDVNKIREQISGGKSLSRAVSESGSFPELALHVITVGEESGTLEKSLFRIADEYEREVDGFLKSLIRILEPTIILVMGLIVGFIVLSMLLPIFQINMIVH